MSSNDFEKTVFRTPQPGGDKTVVKPSPGRRAPPNVGAGAYSAAPPPSYTPQNQNATQFATEYGLNPLVNAASTLIAVFEQTRNTMSHPDVPGLHQRLTSEIKAFEAKAGQTGVRSEIVLAARYVLCTVLDEAVLHTPWGAETAWNQRTLLSIFHNETSGGEKFFMILDRMRQTPAENRHMLELMYIFISLGYEGKYRVTHRGRDALEQLRDELFRMIRSQRGEYERSLSSSWKGLGKMRNSLVSYIPMWVVVSVMGALLVTFYGGFRYWLYHTSTPVVERLSDIAEPQSPQLKK